jgi:hypothetical protein
MFLHIRKAGVIFFSLFFFILLAGTAHALVRIEPPFRDLSIFSTMTFTVDVDISGVNNVYGFQFDLTYNDSILEIVSVSEGTFLNRSGQDRTYCVAPDLSVPGLVNNFACSRVGAGEVNGSGVLANVTFRLKSLTTFPLSSNLSLSEVKISDKNAQPLNNTSENGRVTVYECLSGEIRSCILDSQQGTRTCTSGNVWGSCIATPPPPPPGGGTPSGGGYIPPQDNGQSQNASFKGDVNGDGCVDIGDLRAISDVFGMPAASNQAADINEDGLIDIIDLVLIGLNFGTGDSC